MRRLCLAVLAALLLSTGCSGEDTAVNEGAAREVESAAAADVDASEPEPAKVDVRMAVPDVWSLDPADAGPASITNRVIADLLYDGLTVLDNGGVPAPGLADRWFVSDDRLVWTFVLPDDLVDGAGGPITARDVKASLERVAARGIADQAATSLTAINGWGDRMAGETGGVAGISAPDATTLVIRLDTPYELLLEVLASPAFGVTGESDDSALRTTGAFRATDDEFRFEAIDADAPVAAIELVTNDAGPAAAVAAGDADWGVLASDDEAAGRDADVIRQPLDLQLAIVARSPDQAERIGVLNALEPLLLATSVDGLTARPTPASSVEGLQPDEVMIDLPTGQLRAFGEAVVDQLEEAGVGVTAVTSNGADFAARIASGEAVLFPIVIAGGTGPASASLRLSVPGASDDVFGPESEARAELARAVVTELDLEQRALFIEALERSLIDDGLLLPVGQFEVRIAIGTRLDGLRHRTDGSLDLSDVAVAPAAS
ncbi:MAG: ABC transporter substrate-binding protein [Acidimicrobiales bacterium]